MTVGGKGQDHSGMKIEERGAVDQDRDLEIGVDKRTERVIVKETKEIVITGAKKIDCHKRGLTDLDLDLHPSSIRALLPKRINSTSQEILVHSR